MRGALSEKIISYAVANSYIDKSQSEEYKYGLELILNVALTDITILAIGLAMHMVWEILVFNLIYRGLRKYCGGYHFNSSIKCYLSSCIMFPLAMLLLKYAKMDMRLWHMLFASSAIILFLLAPVSSFNKPLDRDEKILFGKISKILILSIVGLYILAFSIHGYYLAQIISISVGFVSIFAIIGKFKSTVY